MERAWPEGRSVTRSIRSRNAITDEQLAYIKEHGGKVSDDALGLALGIPMRKAYYFRTQLGIPAYVASSFWTDERVALAKDLYCVQGLSSTEAGKILGCDGAVIRRKANRSGWVRDPQQRFGNAARVQRDRWSGHVAVRSPHKAAPAPQESRLVHADDQALIADFLARKGVTKLEPGRACGLSEIERMFGAYKPTSTWVEQKLIAGRNAAQRKAKRAAFSTGQHQTCESAVDEQSQIAVVGVD